MFSKNIEIDFTDLRPEATKTDIIELCDIALLHNYHSVCVNPLYVDFAKDYIGLNNNLKVCTVIGYPLGANSSRIKQLEAEYALMNGVDEIDIVMAIGKFKDNELKYVEFELKTIIDMCHLYGRVCKVIIETGLLTKHERHKAATMLSDLKPDFLKTCTSSKYGPVDMKHIREIRELFPELKIKASGGIKTREQIEELKGLGVERIGTSTVIEL
jgi:deoxyribose-phosphate aldolase